mmetsp:Transcript_5968/g.10653  ORF Transcript_5968/g.10653 Transcript_5968/m.10653 type:complete len:401 (+) Transcript_5968:132-1334(+)
MVRGLSLAAAAVVAGTAAGEVFLKEEFDDASWRERWVDSEWKGKDAMGEWGWGAGKWQADETINKGIITKDAARFYSISRRTDKPFNNVGKDLVVQFSVKNEDKKSSFCGGGYIKLMGKDVDQATFGGDTPYSIMFGPDLCGYDVSRIHLIFNYKGENLLKKEDIKLEYADKDEFTKLYTLHLKPDNTYTVYLDQEEKASGSLPEEWDFPSKEIDDPEDKKPEDWIDEKEIYDETDVKPDGWDDIPEQIVDPEASKPEDWSDEDDGEWEAPMIPNPDYKGPWKQKKIPNPDYKGPWAPRKIANPDYDDSVYAFEDLGTVGFELWIVDNGSIFDNVFVGDNLEEAKVFAEETFVSLKEKERAAKTAFDEAEKAKEAEAEAEAGEVEAEKVDTDEAEEKDEL